METRKLQHAIALARSRNFTRAAEELNLTQSALSRSIQSLEADCGLALFDRGRGGVTPTQTGMEFIHRAEGLLRSEAAFRNFASDLASGTGGRINMGVTPIAARVLVAPVMVRYIGERNFHAEVTIGSTAQLLHLVARQAIDFAIALGDLPGTDLTLTALPLTKLKMAAVVRSGHPLAGIDTMTEEEFQHYPLVRSASYSLESSFPSLREPAPSHPPTVTIDDLHVLEQLVRASDAIWVTAPVTIADALATGKLAALPLPKSRQADVPLSIYSLTSRSISPLVQRILTEVSAMMASDQWSDTAAKVVPQQAG